MSLLEDSIFPCSLFTHCVLISFSHVESESISLKNLKRRSEFFEQGKKKKKRETRLILVIIMQI